jgi:ribosomal protein S17E
LQNCFNFINAGNSFNTDLQEIKTRKQSPMRFFPDKEDYLICSFHSMACYLATGGGSSCSTVFDPDNDKTAWVFRDFFDNSSTKISDILKECNRNGAQIPKDCTTRGLRSGSLQELLDSPASKLEMGIAIGGWDFSGVVTLFEYSLGQQQTVDQAGRCLAKWPDIYGKVIAPRCCFINETNSAKFEFIIGSLFENAYFHILADANLRGYAYSLFATLLMYHEQFTKEFPDNLVSKRLVQIASKEGISEEQLILFGADVKANFRDENSSQFFSTDSPSPQLLAEVQHQLVLCRAENSELRKVVNDLGDLLKESIKRTDYLCNQLCNSRVISNDNSDESIQASYQMNEIVVAKVAEKSSKKKRCIESSFLKGPIIFEDPCAKTLNKILDIWLENHLSTKVTDSNGNSIGWACDDSNGEKLDRRSKRR